MSFQRTPLANRLYLRGTTWWFWGYDHEGQRYRTSTHQTERKTALEAARQIERERAVPSDRAKVAAQKLTLEAAMIMLIAEDERSRARPKTIEFHRNRSRHLLRLLGRETKAAELTLADVNAFVDKRIEELGNDTPQRHTIQKEIRVLIQALNVAKENGRYIGEPKSLRPKAFRKVSSFYKPGEAWLENAEQCQALLDATSNPKFGKVAVDRKLHIAAYIHVGARRDELLTIAPADVNLTARTVLVDGTKTDGARRTVALSNTAVEIFRRKLERAKPGRPVFEPWGKADRDLKANWKRARAALIARRADAGMHEEAAALDARLPRSLSCNDLRRTFCSLMAADGVPAHHCADLLGHKSLDMVMSVYRRVAPVSLHSAVSHLPELALPPVPAAVTTIMRKTNLGELVDRGLDATTA